MARFLSPAPAEAQHGPIGTGEQAVSSPNAISLDIRGQATLPQAVELSHTDLSQIATGTRGEKEASNTQRATHFVAFSPNQRHKGGTPRSATTRI